MLFSLLIIFLYYLIFFGFGLGIIYLLRLRWLHSCLVIGLVILAAIMIKQVITTSPYARIEIKINSPSDNYLLEGKLIKIVGEISHPKSTVYLLIHPKSTPMYWIQDPIQGDDSGNWQGTAYLGTDSLGLTDSYEILALSSTSSTIFNILAGRYYYPGQTLDKLPDIGKSNIITVKRIK